jgi:hypothetical protein
MTRRGLFALIAGVFGARKLPAALKVGDTFTMASVNAVNPPGPMELQRMYNRMVSEQIEMLPWFPYPKIGDTITVKRPARLQP